MKLRQCIYVCLLLMGFGICKDIDAEIIKDLDFFENLDLLEDDSFESGVITEEIKNEGN